MQKKRLIDILNVSPVFQELMDKKTSNFKLLHTLVKAAKEMDEHRQFYIDQEKKLALEYGKKDEKGQLVIDPRNPNIIQFANSEDRIAFNEEVVKLQKTEVEIFDPIVIEENDFRKGELTITPRQMLYLEGFVEFKYNETPKEA